MSHDLYDKDAVVRSSRRMDTVDRIGRNIHCTVKSKCHVSSVNIIVDRLRQVDDIQPFLTQQIGRLLRAVSAKNDQTVQSELVIVLLHRLDLIQPPLIRFAHELERLSGGTENCTTLCENT